MATGARIGHSRSPTLTPQLGLPWREPVLNPVARAPAPEVAAFVAHELRQHHLVHLVGAVDQTRGAGGAVDPLDDGVLGIAARALELDRDVSGMMQRVGDMHLRHRY